MLTFSSGSAIFNFCVALGIGLLVGAERERRKGEGPWRRSAGIRTFAACALTGFVAQSLGGTYLLITALLILGTLTGLSYQRSKEQDPGLTSEVSILLTCLLGALSVQTPDLAALIGIVLTAMLAARERMHQFVRQVITEHEMEDVIVFLAVALIFLPLAPRQYMGPLEAFNPHDMVRFVVMVMTISALGHMAKRMLGLRGGMAVAGFSGGFISSTATILAMGQAAKNEAQHVQLAAMGAVLSTVSTMIQLGLLVSLLLPELLVHMLMPLGLGALTASLYARWMNHAHQTPGPTREWIPHGHVFDLKTTLTLSLAVLGITILTAGLNRWLGAAGVMLAALLSGLVDAHATVLTMSGLLGQQQLSHSQAQMAILLALSANTLSKTAVVLMLRCNAFTTRVLPGLLSVLLAVWLGVAITLLPISQNLL